MNNNTHIKIDCVDWNNLTYIVDDRKYYILVKDHPICPNFNCGHCIDTNLPHGW